MQTAKSGIRVLGIAESFVKGAKKSVFAGIVMRRDLIVDGVSFNTATVGGLDANNAILKIYESLNRRDIHCIMLSGCIVSWFNIINVDEIHKITGLPVVCVTYEDSKGLEDKIEKHFPGDEKRLTEYKNLGKRDVFVLKNGYEIYLRRAGITYEDAGFLCNAFAGDGRSLEPLRVAGLAAFNAVKFLQSENYEI